MGSAFSPTNSDNLPEASRLATSICHIRSLQTLTGCTGARREYLRVAETKRKSGVLLVSPKYMWDSTFITNLNESESPHRSKIERETYDGNSLT